VRQRLEQKIAMENAFRAVNKTPPSPASAQPDDNLEGQSADTVCDLKGRLLNFVGQQSSGKMPYFEATPSVDSEGYLRGETENFEGHCEGHSQGHLKGIPLSIALSTVSALFADERLPLRYLESLMHRLRNGRDPDQAALTFDGFGLSWSWRLDSDSLSSLWLASTGLDSLSILEESVPADDWSMEPPTAGDWSVAPPTAADWSMRPPTVDDFSINLPTFDMDYVADFPRNCSMLPALQRPLSGLLLTTDFLEFPDQSHDSTDARCSEDFQIPGGIFCHCCDHHLEHRSSAAPAGKLWDPLDTVDFYIDDGTDVVAGYFPPAAADKRSHSRTSSRSDDEDDKEFDAAERIMDDFWKDLLHGCDDPSETLV